MTTNLKEKCVALISELELGTASSVGNIIPLAGGVSSDIVSVELGSHKLCAKFALAKLKVAADWHAPVHRNRAEYAWLQFAARIAPQSAVKLYGRSERLHGFVMEYLEGTDVYLWKTALLTEQEDHGEAQRVGDLIGQIHAASAKSSFNASEFQNQGDFHSLRIEPYLDYTASQHPPLAKALGALSNNLKRSDQVLVHGDISPKNILFRGYTPIILDAECATMGDASFDLAFCLNHLLIKAIHLPTSSQQQFESVMAFWQSYTKYVNWEATSALESRVCHLLPALMLARIDGKSPIEYLSEANQAYVRALAISLIESPCRTLQEFTHCINTKLAEAASSDI